MSCFKPVNPCPAEYMEVFLLIITKLNVNDVHENKKLHRSMLI